MKVFQADRAAEKAALEWEDTARAEYEREMAALAIGKSYSLPPEKRHDDFNSFVSEIWLSLQVRSGSHKPTTVAFFENMSKPIMEYLKDLHPLWWDPCCAAENLFALSISAHTGFEIFKDT